MIIHFVRWSICETQSSTWITFKAAKLVTSSENAIFLGPPKSTFQQYDQ